MSTHPVRFGLQTGQQNVEWKDLVDLWKAADDWGYGICLDPLGGVYITGKTDSGDIPVSGDAYQAANAGDIDAFLIVLDSSCTSLTYATYLGGAGADIGESVMLDSIGSMLIAGQTGSVGFPITQGSYDTTYNGGLDAYVVKMDPEGREVREAPAVSE